MGFAMVGRIVGKKGKKDDLLRKIRQLGKRKGKKEGKERKFC